MKTDKTKALRESQMFAIKTLVESASRKLGRGLSDIQEHTTSGRITDETGCPLDFQEQAALLVEVRSFVDAAKALANELWDEACKQAQNEEIPA